MQTFHSLIDMIDTLRTEQECREYLEMVMWNGVPVCPHCGSISEHHYRLTSFGKFKDLYKCRDCHKRFTVTVHTMFEGSHIPLKKWFYAIYVFLGHKKGISRVQLAKDIKVTQKTAWFMLCRIRENLRDNDADFQDCTQVDETYVGGKTKRKKGGQGRSTKQKTPVMGLLSDGKVYAKVIKNTSKAILQVVIEELVPKGTIVVTDEWAGYNGVHKAYRHETVRHKIKQYVNERGFHTNSIEGFWSHLKRGIFGIYHLVTKKHLPRYVKEFVYRYNTRDISDGARFTDFLQMCGYRYDYRFIIGKEHNILAYNFM